MKVLTATAAQHKALNGFENKLSKLEFVKDLNGNWIVGIEILTDPNFSAINEQLMELELIDFIEPTQ
jgi:hypothetical protein